MKKELRRGLARLSFEEKIRKVGELIRLRQKIKSGGPVVSEEPVLSVRPPRPAPKGFLP